MPAHRLTTCCLLATVAILITLSSTVAAVASPSESKALFYQCVLDNARASGSGNPMVAAYSPADQCSSEGLSEPEREQVIGTVTREIMGDFGMSCIGTGCE